MFGQAISTDTPLIVYTLSDASGQTAEMMAKAVISQFQGLHVRIVRLPRLVAPQQLVNMITLAAQGPCVFAFTLVREDLRITLEAEAERARIPTIDLLGPSIACVAKLLDAEPRHEPGAVHTKDEEYFKRMDEGDAKVSSMEQQVRACPPHPGCPAPSEGLPCPS